METSASFEARSAPSSYPTVNVIVAHHSPAFVVVVQSSNLRNLNHRPKVGILDGSRRGCVLLQ